MSEKIMPIAVIAADLPPRSRSSVYPASLAQRLEGRTKQVVGDVFGLTNFGVNRTTLAPGAMSALRHAHRTQDELVYILEGTPTLYTDQGPTLLSPGMVAGFKAGTGDAHHLINHTDQLVVYLEVGDRTPGDMASYPDDDLVARLENGAWVFTDKRGNPLA